MVKSVPKAGRKLQYDFGTIGYFYSSFFIIVILDWNSSNNYVIVNMMRKDLYVKF